MAVVVDEITFYPTNMIKPPARRFGNHWCHMFAENEEDVEELHAMARRIGIPRSAFQDARRWQFKHYDLIPSKRAKALAAGAKETTAQERGRRTAAQIAEERDGAT